MATSLITGTTSLAAQISSLVTAYQADLVSKKVTPLQAKKSTLSSRLSALNALRPQFQSLYDTSSTMTSTGTSSPFAAYSISNSNSSVITASASSSASVGSHTILVTQLAKADMALSDQLASASTSILAAEGAGTKTIQVGGKSVNVTLAADDTNTVILGKIATAINSAGGTVSASTITDTATTTRLVLTSASTGSTNAISMSDTTGTLLANVGLTSTVIGSRTALTSTTAGYSYTSTATLDAKFKFDTLDFVRQSNTVSDVLTGVTINLNSVQGLADTPVSLNISVNKTQVRSIVQQFINNYNSLLSSLRTGTAIDVANNTKGTFAGDSTIMSLKASLQSVIAQKVGAVDSGNPDVLFKIGIKPAADGSLSLVDSTKFEAALTTSSKPIADLFGSVDGFATQMKSLLSSYVADSGYFDTSAASLNNQITALSTTIKNTNNRIARQVIRYQDDFTRLQTAYSVAVQQQTQINTILGYSTTG
jgi:flagellar hook-associated protein 2